MPPIRVRWLVARDLPEVVAIEYRTGSPCPLSADDIRALLKPRNRIGMIAELKGGPVLGYAIYELRASEIDLMVIVVDPRIASEPDWSDLPVFESMVAKLKDKLCPSRRARIVFRIPDKCLAWHLAFRDHGFRAVGVEREEHCDMYRFEFDCRVKTRVNHQPQGV